MFPVRSSNENEVTSAVPDRMPQTRGALARPRLIVIGMLFATLPIRAHPRRATAIARQRENAAQTIRSSDLPKPLNPLKINNLRSQRELHR